MEKKDSAISSIVKYFKGIYSTQSVHVSTRERMKRCPLMDEEWISMAKSIATRSNGREK